MIKWLKKMLAGKPDPLKLKIVRDSLLLQGLAKLENGDKPSFAIVSKHYLRGYEGKRMSLVFGTINIKRSDDRNTIILL